MTEETETPHPDYVKGFNEGYILSKHMPDLAAKLPQNLPGERGQGLKAGKEQYLNEVVKESLPTWLKPDRLTTLYDKKEPTKDKDLDSPERN